ncbi:Transcriptional activator of fatty acid utilization [Linnemannia hyalina]|uniref:Transcriptional activator of fatty acid utilization n=1 Tax=Linnemannia hyalina TaxID=64524 RepID=A0A9P8BY78_9FUNG|nr:Transcriptional activator of fatty acid utilization [Linnemannia hyalina]
MESLLGGLVHTGDRPRTDIESWTSGHGGSNASGLGGDDHDDDLDSLDAWAPTDPPHNAHPSSSSNNSNGTTSSAHPPGHPSHRAESPLAFSHSPEPEDDISTYNERARRKINALSDSMDSMTLDEGVFSRYLGNSSGIDLIQKNQLLKNGYLMVPLKQKDHYEWQLETEAALAQLTSQMTMPPQDLADHLIDTYWTYIHPHMPVLHKPLFMRQYKNADPEKRPPAVLLNAMFSIASRFSDHPEIVGLSDPEDFGVEYFSRAKRLVDLDMDMPRQASIQALLLMTLYRFTSTKCGGRGVWVMLGQATRMAQDLGMHRNSARWSLPPLETEIRKRLWWACYVMDRWVCASLGRPIAIDDADCDVDYPSAVEQDYVDADGNAASPHENSDKINEESSFFLRYFVEHIKLAKLVGLILRRIYAAATRTHGPAQVSSTVAELDTLLTKWLLDLPQDLRYDHQATTFNRWVAIIHSSYYTALILLHRPYMIPTLLTKSNLSDSMPSLNICVSAANSITHLAKRLHETDNLKYLWAFSCYELFTASLIHLTNSASIDMRLQTQSRNNLVTSILVLKRESGLWFNASRVSKFLEDLMCAHLNFEEYNSEGRSMHPVVVSDLTDNNNVNLPIVLRDGHPSGGSLLVAPKESTPTSSQTPPSAVSTPNSSPSTPTTGAPMDTSPDGGSPGSRGPMLIPMRDVPPSSSPSTTAPPTSGASTTHPAVTPRPMKKSRKPVSNSQRNSLLFNSSTPSPSPAAPPAAPPAFVSSTPDHPTFSFSSLSIPGMFTQGQAFPFGGANCPAPGAPQQQQQQPQQQQQQPQYQQQQPQQFQPQQPQQQQQSSFQYSATPLFSSPLALQQQTATGSSIRKFPTQQQGPPGSQPPQHPQVQQLQQGGGGNSGLMQYQQQMQSSQGYSSQGGFIPPTSSAAQGYVNGMTGGGPPMRDNNDYSNFSLFPQQDASAPAFATSTTGAGSPATAVTAAGTGASPMPPSTTAGGGGSPGLFQDPNVMAAVPNPFFGVPNTIDWDEWQQYIANAGLQKF